MLPSLNPEILFAIGKKLVEDGDSESVIRFALSGKEQLQAMKNVFASAGYFKLYYDGYIIGWDVSKIVNQRKIDKTRSKCLMKCIGKYVIDLEIHDYSPNSEKEIIDTIIAKKQLISFSIATKCIFGARSFFINEFLPQFSSTLKHVSIPSVLMTSKFRDSFNLESLTINDNVGDNLSLFCCKTTSLAFKKSHCLSSFDRFVAQNPQLSPHLSSIKQITFDRTVLLPFSNLRFEEMMKYFPPLQLMKFLVSYRRLLGIPNSIVSCIETIASLDRGPTKLVIEISGFTVLTNLENYQQICEEIELECDPSISDFYCFQNQLFLKFISLNEFSVFVFFFCFTIFVF